MRKDALGLFWHDEPVVRAKKPPPAKRTPPERTWEAPDYLPLLDEALRFDVPLIPREDLWRYAGQEFVYDIEVYPNYFLAAFTHYATGKVIYFELSEYHVLDTELYRWCVYNLLSTGFNSLGFDMVITALALAGKDNRVLKEATNRIIVLEEQPWKVLKSYKVKGLDYKVVNHIDLIEVAPLFASLKIYGGRMHVARMQDLPFPPETELSYNQMCIVRLYCIKSDLPSTAVLRHTLEQQIALRYKMSSDYGLDLRSKSDAQIAEAVIAKEVGDLNGAEPHPPKIEEGTVYKYNPPHFLKFQSDLMWWTLNVVRNANFVVSEFGNVGMPPELAELQIRINDSVYRMGIGGLHSSEKSVAYVTDQYYVLKDRDVVSYYPLIILLLGLYPSHLGPNFLRVYKMLVDMRLDAKARANKAKKAGNKEEADHYTAIADSLKIVINGSYGKLGSQYSVLYAPDLLIQVTMTGQLSLLMLIERLELAGIPIVSANTDGIVLRCPVHLQELADQIVAQWEKDTGFETEETLYKALLSRDVNNYIAVKTDGTIKGKGAYANPWRSNKNPADKLHKNPAATICMDAITDLLLKQVPVEETIRNCRDITKFISVRTVKKPGAVKVMSRVPLPQVATETELLTLAGFVPVTETYWKHIDESDLSALTFAQAVVRAKDLLSPPAETQFLGKAIRWYYASGEQGEIIYIETGNKVAMTQGAKPLMDLPTEFPDDVDFDWYISATNKILKQIGYL